MSAQIANTFTLKSFDDCMSTLDCKKCGYRIRITDNVPTETIEREADNHACDENISRAYQTMVNLSRFAPVIEGKKAASIKQWALIRTLARVTGVDADSFIQEVTGLNSNAGVGAWFMSFVIDYFKAVNEAKAKSYSFTVIRRHEERF